MNHIALNPKACSYRAGKRWRRLQHHFASARVWEGMGAWPGVLPGDKLISAGGDGTFHALLNGIIREYGEGILEEVSFGHVGLGSNNSFLRPYSRCELREGIPMRVSDSWERQDLMKVTIRSGGDYRTVYSATNLSLGFLARANLLFNSSRDIGLLKKLSADVADVYTFFKCLGKWRPLQAAWSGGGRSGQGPLTNLHVMKRPYYASDLRFEEDIPPTSGTVNVSLLGPVTPTQLVGRFVEMMALKKYLRGRSDFFQTPSIQITCPSPTPLEVDGEIYWGDHFQVDNIPGGIKLCL